MTWEVFIWRADGKRLHREWFGAYAGPRPTIGRTIQLRWLDERDGVNTPTGEPFSRERVVRVKPQVHQIHVMSRHTSRASTLWIRIRRATLKRIQGGSP